MLFLNLDKFQWSHFSLYATLFSKDSLQRDVPSSNATLHFNSTLGFHKSVCTECKKRSSLVLIMVPSRRGQWQMTSFEAAAISLYVVFIPVLQELNTLLNQGTWSNLGLYNYFIQYWPSSLIIKNVLMESEMYVLSVSRIAANFKHNNLWSFRILKWMFNVDNMQKYLYSKYLHTYSYSLIHIMVKQHTQHLIFLLKNSLYY